MNEVKYTIGSGNKIKKSWAYGTYRITLIANTTIDNSHSKESPSYHMVVIAV